MEYFSQCGEDKHIYEKYLKDLEIKDPTYLELGAANGILWSNTLFFEKYLNWHGILIEPHPSNFRDLTNNRPNNKLFNKLISNSKVPVKYLYFDQWVLGCVAGVKETMPEGNMVNYYLNKDPWYDEMRKVLKESEIMPVPLSDIIKESGYDHIDFFSLDVEGHEYQVLESFDWSIPINIFLIETNPEDPRVRDLLEKKDYIFIEYVAHNALWFSRSFKELIDKKKDTKNM